MKGRAFIMVLILLASCVSASGQQERGILTGRVTDSGGAALAGASVVIDSLKTGVAADNNGRYQLRGLKEGSYHLRYSYTGYDTRDTVITVRGETVVNIILPEALYIAEDVVVKAGRAGNRTPMAHTTVEAATIRKNDMTRDMPFLLSLTPSVVETSDAGNGVGYTSLRVRGTDASRINITIDGVPLNDAESQQVFWVDLPDLAASAGTIQLQRGVGTSSNGSGAFGASINISTLMPPHDPGSALDLSYGSFNTLRASAKIWTGDLREKFNMMVRASHISSDGYIDHSASDINSAMITGTWSAPSSRIRFNIITGNERTGISWWGVPAEILPLNRRYNPSGEYTDSNGRLQYYDDETDNYKQTHYHLFYTHLFKGHLSLNTGLHLTKGKGYYEEQKSGVDPAEYGLNGLTYDDQAVTETDIVQRKWLDNLFYGAVWSIDKQAEKTDYILGGALNRYDGDHYGRILWLQYPGNINPDYEWYRNNGIKDEFTVYGKVIRKITGTLSSFVDLQVRSISYQFRGPDDDMKELTANHNFTFFNPKAGLFWSDGGGNDLFISVSVAHREPTRADFKDAAGDLSATPQAEMLIDYETGYSFRNARMALGLNLYLMQYRDQLVPTGRISNTGYPVMTNVPESRRAGIELSGRYTPVSLVSFAANLTLSRSTIQDFRNYYFDYNTTDWSEQYVWKDLGTVDIAYSPRITGSAEIEVHPVGELSLRMTGKYVGSQYFDNTMSAARKLNPYFFSNFNAWYDFRLHSGELTVKLAVNNIFNAMYQNNAYGGMWSEDGDEKTWAYYFPQAGINFNAGVSLTF